MKSMSVVVLFAAACGAAGDVTSSVEELSAALPTKTWVAMTPDVTQPPDEAPLSCATLGASTFGVLTHKIAADADGVLGGVLDDVHVITMSPPTAVAPGHAVWGPIPSATSSVYRLSIVESAPAKFQFLLEGRDTVSDWRGVFAGVTFTPDATHRTGQIVVDFAVMHALDASVDPAAGQVTLHFDVSSPARNVAATFAGIRGKSAPQPDDAAYQLVTAADHSSGFAYSTRIDFDGDGTPDELAHIDSQWAPNGAGVAHLVVSGGSLGARVVNAVECWDASLSRVFYKDDASMKPAVGDASCCPH
jgi:hypothetical protein